MFIQIEKNPDGSHALQIGGVLETGWAYWDTDLVPIPDTCPYVDIEVAEVTHPATELDDEYTQLEVIAATEREIPEDEPIVYEPTTDEVLDVLLGVE